MASPELRGWRAGYQRRNHGLEAQRYTKSELGNSKRRRHEAAIAEGKKPLPTRGSGERRKLRPRNLINLEYFMLKGIHFGLLLISYF